MSKIGEISGVEVYLSPQQYEEYKNSLEDEIERLNKQYELMEEALEDKAEEIERLNNIIKEVREDIEDTIERYKYYGTNDLDLSILSFWVEQLQILDKGE